MYDKEMMTIQMEKGANDDHIYICFLAQGGKTIKVPCAVAKRVFQYAVLHDPFATSWYVCVQASVSSKTLSVICACPRDKYMKGAEDVREYMVR